MRLGPRLLARERQHLLDQTDGALHARRQGFHRRGALEVPARPREHAHLQVQRGERCTQLVRSVGHEGALALQRGAQPCEQIVEGANQGLHLVRQARVGERVQGVDAARHNLRREALQGLERVPDREPDQQRQHRQQQRERLECLQRELRGALLAHAHRLRHLDDLGERLHPEHPPAPFAGGDGGESQGGDLRQHRVRPRQIHPHAIEGPDLHDEVVGRVRRRKLRREQVLDRLVAQDERGLAQVVIEERVRFAQGVAVHDPAARGADEHHAGQEPAQQPRAQRAHGAGLTR